MCVALGIKGERLYSTPMFLEKDIVHSLLFSCDKRLIQK